MKRYDLEGIYFGTTELTNIKPANIWEIGSRDGHDAHVLAQSFHLPDSACHVFEPNPAQVQYIIQQYPTMNVYPTALSDVEGIVKFNVEPGNVGMSSLLDKFEDTPGMKTIDVECRRMEDIIDTWQVSSIDVCKVDVEGMTLRVLKSFGKHLDKLQSVQVECEHKPIWKGGCTYDECAEWLKEHGFIQIMFTLMMKTQSDSFWVRQDRLL